jgi:hypothetical protein
MEVEEFVREFEEHIHSLCDSVHDLTRLQRSHLPASPPGSEHVTVAFRAVWTIDRVDTDCASLSSSPYPTSELPERIRWRYSRKKGKGIVIGKTEGEDVDGILAVRIIPDAESCIARSR